MITRSLSSSRRFAPPGRLRRRAFTLTEVVVAMLLMTAVLSATWSLLNTFRDRFERSQARAERSRLILAVQQTLENDLASGLVLRGRRSQRGRPISAGLDRSVVGGARDDGRSAANGAADGVSETPPPWESPDGAASSLSSSPEALSSSAAAERPGANGPPGDESTVQREEDMTAGDEPTRDARQISMTFQAETDQVSQGEWLANEVRFLGTGSALVCDILTPAEDLAPPAWDNRSSISPPLPGGPSNLPGEAIEGPATFAGGGDVSRAGSPEEFADIPEHSRRIVYLFTDPEAALRTGRAPGLLRCELTNRHLAMIRTLAPEQADLYALVQPLTGVQQTLKDAGGFDRAAGAASEGLGGMEGIAFASNPGAAGLGPGSSAGLVMEPPRIDYIPEVKAFRLRYYDGQTWRDRWDSRQEQELPVAVEMRFLFEFPRATAGSSTNANAGPADGTGGETAADGAGGLAAEMGQAWLAGGALEANPDDRLRSAQTAPVQDHRYVILLSSPPKLRPTSGTPGTGTRDKASPDRFDPASSGMNGGMGGAMDEGGFGRGERMTGEVTP